MFLYSLGRDSTSKAKSRSSPTPQNKSEGGTARPQGSAPNFWREKHATAGGARKRENSASQLHNMKNWKPANIIFKRHHQPTRALLPYTVFGRKKRAEAGSAGATAGLPHTAECRGRHDLEFTSVTYFKNY